MSSGFTMRSVCVFSVAYLENPRRWPISRAVRLLFPLRQWKTMLLSSFSGAFTPNCSWNCWGGSFSDSSSCPTDRQMKKTESECGCRKKKHRFFTWVVAYKECWQNQGSGQPGIHLYSWHQTAARCDWPAWLWAVHMSQLTLKLWKSTKDLFKMIPPQDQGYSIIGK